MGYRVTQYVGTRGLQPFPPAARSPDGSNVVNSQFLTHRNSLVNLLEISYWIAAPTALSHSTRVNILIGNGHFLTAVPAAHIPGLVFGFVSAGLPLGSAITPVPFGISIDQGHPELVLVLVAAILLLSLFCAGSARASARATEAAVMPAESWGADMLAMAPPPGEWRHTDAFSLLSKPVLGTQLVDQIRG